MVGWGAVRVRDCCDLELEVAKMEESEIICVACKLQRLQAHILRYVVNHFFLIIVQYVFLRTRLALISGHHIYRLARRQRTKDILVFTIASAVASLLQLGPSATEMTPNGDYPALLTHIPCHFFDSTVILEAYASVSMHVGQQEASEVKNH